MSAYVPMHQSNNYSNASEVTLNDMGAIGWYQSTESTTKHINRVHYS